MLENVFAPLVQSLAAGKSQQNGEAPCKLTYLNKGDRTQQAPQLALPCSSSPTLQENAGMATSAGSQLPVAPSASASPAVTSTLPASTEVKATAGAKTLEEYEAEAFQKLQNKPVKKRPSAAPSTTAGSKKKKEEAAAPAGGGTSLKLGCKSCRGGINGCAQCRKPTYKGMRLNRAEWKEYAKEHGLK